MLSKNSQRRLFSGFLGLSILQEQKAYNAALIALAIVRHQKKKKKKKKNLIFVFLQFACLVSRFLMISPLSFLLNCKRKNESRITFKMQAVMWNAGLRGAVAYALSLRMPEFPGRALFVTTIHAVVIFTIMVHGGLTAPFLKWTDYFNKSTVFFFFFLRFDSFLVFFSNRAGGDYASVHSDQRPLSPSKPKKKLHGFWSNLDKTYLIPFLSYPRNVYKQEAEEKEKHLAAEMQDTSLISEEGDELGAFYQSRRAASSEKHFPRKWARQWR